MKLLILGGTRFVGRHLVAAALARGHAITLFNRGNYSSAPFAVETILGDRYADLGKLAGRRWNAVVDLSGFLPRAVKSAAGVLADSVDRYVFVSSQSVYGNYHTVGLVETSPVARLTEELLEVANKMDTSGYPSYGAMYGGLKALCEQAAEEVMPGRVLIVRPGLIVGPYDYTDRFTYWVARVARGGEVLAPGRAERPVQFIDARDLAEWIVSMTEQNAVGVYNANGPPGAVTMADVLTECKFVSNSDAEFTWVSEAFLQQEKVAAWSEMPLWLPEEDAPELQGFMFVNCDKAFATGLHLRSLNETVRDTLSWIQNERGDESLKAGIDTEREQMLLRKWREAN